MRKAEAELKAVNLVLTSKASDGFLSGLRKAANATLEVRRAVYSFRTRCLRCPEEGPLFETIEAWYVQKYAPHCRLDEHFESLENRNPYARFKAKHRGSRSRLLRTMYSKLDFLLDEIPVRKPGMRKDLGLTEEETAQLLMDLTDGGKLASLIRPSLYLTHEENVAIAVLDARLWLYNSELPVEIGSPETYRDVRSGAPVPRVPGKIDVPPSTFHVMLLEGTVGQFRSMRVTPFNLYHPQVTDFAEADRGCYFARLARVRFSHLDRRRVSAAEFAAECARACIDDEEAAWESLEDFKWNETRAMYKLLAKFIFDVDVDFDRETAS